MKDKISIERVKALHPKVIEDFKNFITDAEQALGIVVRVSQGMRTFKEQQALYELGRTKEGKVVTNAKPGTSYHQYGLAVDLVEMVNGGLDWNFDMSKLLPYAEKYGIEWGGNWHTIKDYPHWQKTFDWGIRALLDKYNKKDFIPNTTFVNI